jgi:hypothetical protein
MASSRTFGSVTSDMQSLVHTVPLPIPELPQISPPRTIPPNAGLADKKLLEMRVDELRAAIRNNQVSFPSQIPTFSKHTRPDLQRKLVQLYFICGWAGSKIRARYGLGSQRFQQILSTWKNRAIELGLIQTIPPEQEPAFPGTRFGLRVTLSATADASFESGHPLSANTLSFQVHKKRPSTKQTDVSARPRSKCDSTQIAAVLKDLERGRGIAEIASEVGVTASTIRLWKRQREMQILQRENRELKERLVKLGSIEKNRSAR